MASEEIDLNEYFAEMDRVDSVVGGASESECTYDKGYLPRQAVYSCLDCTPPTSEIRAGFCHACCMNCHKTHNVEEIYTKRNFRCDCGTLPQLLCSLKTDIDIRNSANTYTQNYSGLYCQCSRPYPDEERPEMDTVEMMQCFVCEDWFHSTHLNTVVPERYEEMACVACAGKHSFLSVYAIGEVENVDVDVVEVSAVKNESVDKCKEVKAHVETVKSDSLTADKKSSYASSSKTKDTKSEESDGKPVDLKRPSNESAVCEPSSKRKKTSLHTCKLTLDSAPGPITRALFFDDQFRHTICKCQSCLDLYKEQNISFVSDPVDTLNDYEEKAQARRQQEEEELEKTLEGLPHQAKCDVARAIGSLKGTLQGLISKFVKEGKDSVGREEIVEAFKTMAAETNTVDPSIFDNIGK